MTSYTFSVVATNSIGSGEAGVVMITTPSGEITCTHVRIYVRIYMCVNATMVCTFLCHAYVQRVSRYVRTLVHIKVVPEY